MPSPETIVGERPDIPATSYRILPPGRTAVLTLAVVAVAAAAWVITARMAGSMADMVNGLGQVGRRMPNKMGSPSLLWMWTVMMTAMMAPTVVPAALAHRVVRKRRNEGALPTAAFVAGFLSVWALVGVLYLLPFLWFRGLAASAAESWWLPIVGGAILVFGGGYQFSRRKAHCQGACCAPVMLVLEQDGRPGTASAFRAGLHHGVHCLGCCWALMTVLLVVGLMNLVWMIGLSLLFLIEKHWRGGLLVGRAVGVGLVMLGFTVMAWPGLLHTISGVSAAPPAMPAPPP